MPKKKATGQKMIKLRDLAPKKDPQGGGRRSFFGSAPLSIPPPGFISSPNHQQGDKNH